MYSSTKAYVQNSKYFVRTDVDNGRGIFISALELSNSDEETNSLDNVQLAKAAFPSTILCSTLNSDAHNPSGIPTKYAVGLVRSAHVNSIGDTRSRSNLVLDTRSSDVYCVKFKPMVIII